MPKKWSVRATRLHYTRGKVGVGRHVTAKAPNRGPSDNFLLSCVFSVHSAEGGCPPLHDPRFITASLKLRSVFD